MKGSCGTLWEGACELKETEGSIVLSCDLKKLKECKDMKENPISREEMKLLQRIRTDILEPLGRGDKPDLADFVMKNITNKVNFWIAHGKLPAKKNPLNNPIKCHVMDNPKKKKEIDLPRTNLTLKGFGRDRNGNSIIKLAFPNGKGFSIQTLQNLPKTHSLKSKGMENFTKPDLTVVKNEVVSHIKKFGSAKQKDGLRTFKNTHTKKNPIKLSCPISIELIRKDNAKTVIESDEALVRHILGG